MGSNTALSAPRQDLLEELRGRLIARLAAIKRRLSDLSSELEKLELERIELQAELHVIEEEKQKCRGKGKD